MDQKLLNEALALLESATPLHSDCGALCDSCCCKDNGEAGRGVWILPGEDDKSFFWGTVEDSVMPVTDTPVKTLFCHDSCLRSLRPFMCRIFPLSPYWSAKQNAWSVRMDRRAAAVCPLFAYGKKGLSPDFTARAAKAVRLLAADDEGVKWLKILEEEEAAYRITL